MMNRDQLRTTRSAAPDAGQGYTDVFLGVDGKPFEFEDVRSNVVVFVACSALKGDLAAVRNWGAQVL